MFRAIFAVSKKELRQLKRDWRFMFALLFLPAILLVLYGYVLNFDIKRVNFAVLDMDRTSLTREIANSLNGSEYFIFKKYVRNYMEGEELLISGKISFLLVIPQNFTNSLNKNQSVSLQCLVDGSNSNKGTIVLGYLNGFFNDFHHKLLLELRERMGVKALKDDFLPSLRVYFNQELRTTKFMIPGLIAFILMITTVLSTSLSMVREKERGTLEQLYVTPLKSLEFAIGKIIPYIIISITATTMIVFLARFLFEVEIRGSYLLLFLSTCLFISCTLTMGFLISTIAETQRVAFLMAALTSLLPSILLSGFIFPIENMPVIIQFFTYFVPARYFIKILRQIILKGASLDSFLSEIFSILALTFVFLSLTLVRIRISRRK